MGKSGESLLQGKAPSTLAGRSRNYLIGCDRTNSNGTRQSAEILKLSKIEISNPLHGGMAYTSEDRARYFERRGLGRMQGGKFFFYEDTQESRNMELLFAQNRGGMLYWNGNDRNPYAMHRPGEVVS
jgi:hypothetical protein